MANREASGLTALRILIGVFLVFEGIAKVRWLFDASLLASQLQGWQATAWSANRWYLETVCLPYVQLFARLVPLGELAAGAALILGVWARGAAAVALLMVLNFHFASGALFQYRFLTNGYGLPVVGSLLALAIGAGRLPLSLGK